VEAAVGWKCNCRGNDRIHPVIRENVYGRKPQSEANFRLTEEIGEFVFFKILV
jgi:hypothetical protein